MPLRNIERWRAWLDRDRPSGRARRTVAEFLLTICEQPWAAPSYPVPLLSDQPVSEMRVAELSVPGEPRVTVYYRQHYEDGAVDVVDVAQVPERR